MKNIGLPLGHLVQGQLVMVQTLLLSPSLASMIFC